MVSILLNNKGRSSIARRQFSNKTTDSVFDHLDSARSIDRGCGRLCFELRSVLRVPFEVHRERFVQATVSSTPSLSMAGTWPSSPGFGRHTLDGPAMQRQPEPSDGRPKVPDACNRKYHSPQQSKRGKTRFRDDRSRRHPRGANSNRHNVKKLDNSLSRCDPFSIRKDSPSKAFTNLNLQSKSDKSKLEVKPIDKNVNLLNKNVQNPLEGNAAKAVCAQRLFIEPPMLIRVDENIDNVQIGDGNVRKNDVEPIQTDVDMKLVDEIKSENVCMKDLHVEEEFAGSSNAEISNNVDDLYVTLREYLQVESKFQPLLSLPTVPQVLKFEIFFIS